MPIMPYVDEGQRLVPGSPVPIGGEREARLPGEAVANLGQAMFNLGDALDLAARKTRDEKNKLEEMEAFTAFRKEQQRQQAIAQASGLLDGDDDGNMAVDSYRDSLTPTLDAIANAIPNDDVRRKFKIRAEDLVADSSMQVLANQIVKRTQDNEIKRGRIISNLVDTAKDNPNNLDEYLAEAESVIYSDTSISDAQKEALLNQARKGIVNGTIQEQILKGQITGNQQHFNKALAVLDQHGKGLYDDVERGKQIDNIFQEQYKTDGRLLQQENRKQQQIEKGRIKLESDLMGLYSSQLSLAGNSDIARAPIITQIEKDILAGRISKEKGESLKGSRVFMEAADDKYEADLMSVTYRTGRYKQAMDKIEKDKGLKVSNDRAGKLLEDIQRWKERTEKDPIKNQLIQDGEELLKSFGQESINDPLSSLQKREIQARIVRTVGEYHKALMRNPDADPVGVASYLYQKNFKTPLPDTRPLKGNVPNTTTPEKTQSSMDSLLKNYADEKKRKGNLTKEREQYYKDQFNYLNKATKKFMILGEPNATNSNSNSAVTPGARGK